MGEQSLLKHFTSVAGRIGAVLNALDIDLLDRSQQKLVGTIKMLLADARLDIRDWEMADSRAEMLENAEAALKRIEQVRASMLLASQSDIFSALDIAELTANFDRIESELRA